MSAFHSQPIPGTAARRPHATKQKDEAVVRRQLEEQRGYAYTEEEWADAKYRLVSLAKLARRWAKTA